MDDDCDDFTSEHRRVRWSFQPLQDVRPDVAGEVVFIKKWQKLMGGTQVVHDEWFVDNEPWSFPILDVFPFVRPNERDTRVASSVIRWLGAPLGLSFLGEVERLTAAFAKADASQPLSDIHTMAWALANQPRGSVNHGATPRTAILDTHRPDLRDILTMEQTIHWLGSERGQDFVQDCRQTLARQLAREQARRMRRLRP